MIRTGTHKYCRYTNGWEELYDLESDPGELHDLAASLDHEPVKARLAERLESWLTANSDPFATFEPTPLPIPNRKKIRERKRK